MLRSHDVQTHPYVARGALRRLPPGGDGSRHPAARRSSPATPLAKTATDRIAWFNRRNSGLCVLCGVFTRATPVHTGGDYRLPCDIVHAAAASLRPSVVVGQPMVFWSRSIWRSTLVVQRPRDHRPAGAGGPGILYRISVCARHGADLSPARRHDRRPANAVQLGLSAHHVSRHRRCAYCRLVDSRALRRGITDGVALPRF